MTTPEMNARSGFALRLPPDLRVRLQERAKAHARSLNGEIVHALRHYVDGMAVVETRYTWNEPEEETRQAWEVLAGETLRDDGNEGWQHTPEELVKIARMAAAG